MKNIDKLIEFLKAENVAFSMTHWNLTVAGENEFKHTDEYYYGDKEADNFRGCGTIACIGGSAALIRAQELQPGTKFSDLEHVGTIGSYREAYDWIIEDMPYADPSYDPEDLFEPDHETACFEAAFGSDDYIERAKAIRVLEHFRDTGEINWDL